MRGIALLALALFVTPVMAQDAPVPTPVPALDTQEEPVPHIVVEKPVAPAAVTPVPVPRVQTTAQIQADKALQDQATEDLNTRAADVSAACGSDIKARIDWTHIDPAEINRDSTANVCAAALDAVEEACATPSARPLIGREVRQIVCTAGPTPSVDLHGGTMVYTLDWQSRNPGAFVYEYLMQHL